MSKKDKSPIRYIYGLIDPRNNTLFYVGQAISPTRRLHQHKAAVGCNSRMRDFVRQMKSEGFVPEMIILRMCHKLEVNYLEKCTIGALVYLGMPLLNVEHTHEDGVDMRNKYMEYSRVKRENEDLAHSIVSFKEQADKLYERLVAKGSINPA